MSLQRKLAELTASIPERDRWKVDREIDFENADIQGRTIPQHLGRIAAEMINWEDVIADRLGLTATDRADIMEMYPRKPSLQRREALSIWKSRRGSQATYRALMEVFVKAGRVDCAETIVEILKEGAEMTESPPQAGAAGTLLAPPLVPSSSGSFVVSISDVQDSAATPQSIGLQAQTPNVMSVNTVNPALLSPPALQLCPQLAPLPSFSDMAVQPCSPSCSLEAEIKQLDEEYTEIESLVLETIKHYHIPHKTVLRWVQALPMTLKAEFSEILRKQAKELTGASSVDELFMILSPFWDALHPTLLEHLVKKLADGSLSARMRRYMECLHNFRLHTTLGNFIDKWTGGVPPGFDEYVLKLGDRWKDKTLEDFYQFLVQLSKQKCFGRAIPYMRKVKRGCLAVVVAFPQSCFPLTPDDDLQQYLRENMVLRVLEGDVCVLNLEVSDTTGGEVQGHERLESDFPDTGEREGFSPNMTPEQLAQWLLQEGGEAYRYDIDKLKGLIGGELFLQLPDDEELLEQLQLSDAFKALITKKVKQLNESSSTSASVSTPASKNDANLQSKQPRIRQQSMHVNRIAFDGGEPQQGPTLVMRHLGSLKTKSGGRINVMQEVAPHWQNFAVNLDFDALGTTMQTINQKHHSDPEACCREMMQLWLNGRGRQPATFGLLVEILRDCNLSVLAQQVEEAIPYNN